MIQDESIQLMKQLINLSEKIKKKKFNSLQEGLALAYQETELLQKVSIALGAEEQGRNARFFNTFIF